MRARLKKIYSSKLLKLFLIVAFLFVGYQIMIKPKLSQRKSSPQGFPSTSSTKAIVEVKKNFEFPAARMGKKGKKKVAFAIVSAELKDEIKVKGVPRKADKGELFLLLRLEIDNETTERLSLTPSDFIRLVDKEGKKFAPHFHNATIVVDPLSVRKDLVSFIVDEKLKNFKFLVGELEKEKETVEINF